MEKIKGVFWHHSGGTDWDPLASTRHHTAETIDRAHRLRWPGFTSDTYRNKHGAFFHVGYNRVIETTNRRIIKTRRFGEETAAAYGFNDGYIHVVVSGNYDKGADRWYEPNNDLVWEVWQEVKEFAPYLKISDNWPHRKVANKSCYGNSLRDDHIQNILSDYELREGKSVEEVIDERKIALQKQLIVTLKSLIVTLTGILRGKRYSSKQK